ncbi:MAG TPA: trypsin-like peptidase domain-containing protein [Bacteroidota bacterium]|nr:trypsin-like peptidase domain-containing protein [Bacteroidota bacterium]
MKSNQNFSKIAFYLFIILSFFSFQSFKCSGNEPKESSNESNFTQQVVSRNDEVPSKTIYQESTNDITASRNNAITQTVAKASPAIVGINVIEIQEYVVRNPFNPFNDPFFQFFFGDQFSAPERKYQRKVQGLGSGFIISPDGYILTNHHVAGNATKIIVTLTNGEKYDAKLIGADMVSDVALLKINAKNLPYLKLGNSDNLLVGEWAIAFGNPFGLFNINSKPTVTVGVISNLGVNLVNEDQPYNRVYKNMIQTDAAISSGNSGGPLLNANGDVIGVNTMILSTAQSMKGAGSIGIGFAIPINRVKSIVNSIMNGKKLNRDIYIGMEVMDLEELDNATKKAYKIDDKAVGAIIGKIYRNSPADKSGLDVGDIIIKVNNESVNNKNDFLVQALDACVGDKLQIQVKRGDKILTKTLIVESARS